MRKVSTLVGLTLFALATTARAEEAAPAADKAAPPSAGDKAAAPAPAPEADKAATPAGDTAAAGKPELASKAEQPMASKRKFQVGLSFLPMAMGRYIYSPDPASTVSAEASFAYGFGLSAGYEVLPGLIVGLAPQVIFNVEEKEPLIDVEATHAVNQYDLMARVAYVFPIVDNTSVYAEVLPGYSIIKNDATPKGLVLAFGVGAEMDLADRYFVNLGAGYQMGFQSWAEGSNKYQTRTRFVRVALGGGVKF
jgi:hypothetical protein